MVLLFIGKYATVAAETTMFDLGFQSKDKSWEIKNIFTILKIG